MIGPHTQMKVLEEKQILSKHIDTIIVDEVSMVRCDMVDGMDRYLRAAFYTHMPFGGKQVVFVGDLFLLPPVVSEPADEDMLCHLWEKGKPYFYKAHVLKRMNLPKIEFRTVYRQRDGEFLKDGKALRTADDGENDEDERLVAAFNDMEMSDEEFWEMLEEEELGSKAYARLRRRVAAN